MNILSTLTDIVGGSVFKEIKEGIMSYFPPDMSPLDQANMQLKVTELVNSKEKEINQAITEAASALDKRITAQEGSAQDLSALGWVGKPIIFLRGVQRPLWGFATLFMDWRWFFENHIMTQQQQTALIVINILVLGFLFGEKTIRVLQPLIENVFAMKTNTKK